MAGIDAENKSIEEIEYISDILKEASKYGLQAEVVWSALGSMQSNPKQSLEDAMNYGYWEWIK